MFITAKSSADLAFFKVSTLNRLPYANNSTGVPFGAIIFLRGKVKVCWQKSGCSGHES